MKGMATAQEFLQAPPPARYPIQFDAVESGLSGKSESHLKISGSVSDGPFKGSTFFHYIGTDGGTKYGAMGKKHLRALGVDLSSDAEVPDSVLASKLQGLRLMAECGNEPRQKPISEGSKEMITVMEFDTKLQKQVPIMNLTILGYVREPGARIDLGFAPAPQGQPQFQGQPPQGAPQWQGQPGQPQQQYGAPPPGFVAQPAAPSWQQGAPPQGFAPPQPGFVPAGAPPGWNGVPNGAAPQGQPQGAPPGFQPGAPGIRPG